MVFKDDSQVQQIPFESVINDDLFHENNVFVMVRFLLDKELKLFPKQMKKLINTREERLNRQASDAGNFRIPFGFLVPGFGNILKGAQNMIQSMGKPAIRSSS